MPLALIALLVVWLACSPQQALASERWTWPLKRHEVGGSFSFDARVPYASGMRRVLRLRADDGEAVSAPCAGRVTFAGRPPRGGFGVTIACGRLVATMTGLASVTRERGERVIAGSRIGRARASMLTLGARVPGERHGYVDPLALLAGRREPQPPPPPAGAVRWSPPSPAAPPAVVPRPAGSVFRPAARPVLASPAAPRGGASVVPWLGLALLGLGLGAGVPLHGRLVRRHRPHRTLTTSSPDDLPRTPSRA